MKKAKTISMISALLLTFMLTKTINAMQNTKEIWKDVLGYEGLYQVSNLGRVKSVKRVSSEFINKYGGLSVVNVKERVLSQSLAPHGYLTVCLRNPDKKTQLVHRLVVRAFLGQSKLHVDHINLNKKDNRLENLRYVTQRENAVAYWKTRSNKLTGAFKHKNRWRAEVSVGGNKKTIGSFSTDKEAHDAYVRFVSTLPTDVAYQT